MKKWICWALALLMCWPAGALAQTFYVTFEGDCNLRDQAGLDGAVMAVCAAGDTAPFASQAEGDDRGVRWYLVSVDGELGWVSSRYATLTDGTVAPVYFQADWERPVTYTLKADNALQSLPQTGGEALLSLEASQEVDNLGYFYFSADGQSWYFVSCQGQQGWINAGDTIGNMG